MLDDGWQTNEGDWALDPRKFRTEAEMVAFVKAIRAAGLKPKLWLAPLAVDPGSDLLLFKHAGTLDFHDAKISKSGGNTIVQIGDDKIELIGVKPHELSKFDFLFDA